MKEAYKQAILAAIAGGNEILSIYNTDFEVEYKGDDSPLTLADQKANEAIVDILKPLNIPMISEENKNKPFDERKTWTQCWIIDPLDGTKEFVKRNGEFTVNIALVNNQKPVFGVIYVPVTNELFVGLVEENKSYKLIWEEQKNFDENFNDAQVLNPKGSEKMRVVGSRSHMNEDTQQFIDKLKTKQDKPVEIVSKGSSLKFCLVAEGLADVYPRFAPTMEWDTAAGQAICEAVGLQVIDQKTQKPMLYNRENLLNNYFLVTKS
ncbi:3'(2'),5'-bisphosphate nucleotidase CysQ [Mesohalobacter halotolerans]|uniref:3'(2'),5'-bisphosphate nucleotidase CysQ n=1 Tax=Mesohalobacter halotolerans TaxID=1883405 RepID=A0A4U5TRY4_9FLAO|nr:3'(2'),5'-bisphosphate nucleotidase CysQ [Mesohalobacter halotolerans]MBS3737458.1 3'(2'),5'-bisphosphate nucleotidase CysQ [Psychroflexus sp.]TKS57040.1 3'(2'),5'-bisphosphate nucleotidase CysQ [Mesohalobacter halotolerans]